jgi:hypothetical protein
MGETLLSALVLAGGLLGRLIPFMILGVIAAEFIIALGFVNKLSFLARPITRFSHLKQDCGVSFLVAFGSPVAAYAMLAKYHEEGLISKRELLLAAMINSFPGVLLHWRGMLPVIIPLLGTIGLVYFGLFVLIGLVKTALLMVISRILLPAHPAPKLSPENKPRPPLKEAFIQSLKSSRHILKRMVLITVPTMLVISILIKTGVFNGLTSYLSGISAYLPIPASGLSIIVAMFGHPTAAYTVASNLLAAGEIAAKGIILSLFIGSVLSSGISMFRETIPYFVSIFGPKYGIQLTLLSSSIRSGIAIILVVILAIFWQ